MASSTQLNISDVKPELRLVWVGDIEKNKKYENIWNITKTGNFQPKLMILQEPLNRIIIGCKADQGGAMHQLESIEPSCILYLHHATIIRKPGGSFRILDHSSKHLLVNNKTFAGHADLKQGDIICFGFPETVKIEDGAIKEPFYWDLKYRVFIGTNDQFLLSVWKAMRKKEIEEKKLPLDLRLKIAAERAKKPDLFQEN